MLKLHKSRSADRWFVSCPFCFNLIIFSLSSPVYCTKCGEELSNYSRLMDDIDERKVYYILGDTWELGAEQ